VALERIRLVVLDNGPDVPAVRLGNMFEPFVSTKSEGLGLGLSMCATIAESHGGSTALANNRDVGASAILTLPVAKME
jgi:C4-dicarboxylate-specific signal transduction histidine kinase